MNIAAIDLEDALVELVYIAFHELKLQEKYEYMDHLLGEIHLPLTPMCVLLSYLTITATCKHKLKNRKRLYDFAFAVNPESCAGLQ